MRVLIIDDEMNICLTLRNILVDENYQVEYSVNAEDGLELFKKNPHDLVFLDVRLDGMNGLELLEKIMIRKNDTSVIMISGHSGIREAVKAIKLGAFDFLEKPLSLTKVKIAVKNAVEFKNLSKDYIRLRSDINEQYKIIGNSKYTIELKDLINRVAPSDSKVLIRGESGTGKELIAYGIHNFSSRRDKPFIKFNSAAIPNELVESELFGYEKGAFTGAVSSKNGKIEQADRGTLFLDEIGDMNLNAQAKILRVIQEGEFERVGSNKTLKINTRIIAATHKNLEKLVEENAFREDLYYRLNVIPIQASPLRDHPEDIPVLIDHFSTYFSNELKLPKKEFSQEVLQDMSSWKFKGNVRELKNIIERIYILVPSENIDPENLNSLFTSQVKTDFWNETMNFKDKKKQFEKKYLETQLRIYNGNLTSTAEFLGLQTSNLSRKLKELDIQIQEIK
jgi:two-component system, NtrC family, nitrogen regulation response regulator NtrX